MRPKVLDRRNVGRAHVERRVCIAQAKNLLSDWAGCLVPQSEMLLISNLGQDFRYKFCGRRDIRFLEKADVRENYVGR
jgi:hypothetical protein